MSDFSLKNGSFGGGLVGMLSAALVFLVIPASLATLGLHIFDLAIADIAAGAEFALDLDTAVALQDQMLQFRDDVILYSIPIIILGFPVGFYPKGNFGRVPFGILQAGTIAMWIWYITRGGVLPVSVDIPVDLGGIDVDASVSLTLVLTGFIYLFMIVALAKGAYFFAEYGGNRKKYLLRKQKRESPDESDDYENLSKKDRKKLEKKSRKDRKKSKKGKKSRRR